MATSGWKYIRVCGLTRDVQLWRGALTCGVKGNGNMWGKGNSNMWGQRSVNMWG